jgi:hypothetical protein
MRRLAELADVMDSQTRDSNFESGLQTAANLTGRTTKYTVFILESVPVWSETFE